VLGLGSRFSLLIPASQPAPGHQLEPPPRAPARAHLAPAPAAPTPVSDDRSHVRPCEHPVLVIDADAERAVAMVEVLHTRGEKAIVAAETTAAVELAREHQPKAILLAGDAKRVESAIAELKKHPDTRHLPVVAIGGLAARLLTLRMGAAAFVERSIDPAELDLAMARVEAIIGTDARRVGLVAKPGGFDRLAAVLRSIDEVEVVRIDPSDAAVALRAGSYDLAVMAFDSRELDPFPTLRRLVTDEVIRDLPLVAYVPGELSRLERARLDAVAKAAVIAVVGSPKLMADRATLYLHRAQGTLPRSMRGLLDRLSVGDAPLHGYQTVRAIRAMPGFEQLPIISLTAKAMKGDKEKALEAGASDYIAKPVDVDQLVALLRGWLGAGEPVRTA
jgi:CheY-like chemotaxis protein